MGNKSGIKLGKRCRGKESGEVIQRDIKSFEQVVGGGVDKWNLKASR